MNLKELFTEDRGVSPVIGVILMVAITVILAAVIGAFVLGLGDQASDSAPQVSFDYSFENETFAEVTHSGGDNLDASTIEVTVGDDTIYNDSSAEGESFGWDDDPIVTGNTLTIDGDGTDYSDDTVRIIWSAPGGGSSNTLSDRTWP